MPQQVYSASNVELITKTRTEHLSDQDKSRNKGNTQSHPLIRAPRPCLWDMPVPTLQPQHLPPLSMTNPTQPSTVPSPTLTVPTQEPCPLSSSLQPATTLTSTS